jgi:hypothetical protein
MPRVASNEVRSEFTEDSQRLSGTPPGRVWRYSGSNKHIYAQVIDDAKGTTLTAASRGMPMQKDLKKRQRRGRQSCRQTRCAARQSERHRSGSLTVEVISITANQGAGGCSPEAGLKFKMRN